MASCFEPEKLLRTARASGWVGACLTEPAACVKADRGYFDMVMVK